MKNSIYYSVDEISVARSVEKLIGLVTSQPNLTWGALIDTAFDHALGRTRLDFEPVIECYDFPELHGLKAVSPCLVELSSGSDLRTQTKRLLTHCQGRPMLSFVGVTESLKELSTRWRKVHMVSVVDEHEMLLRFADTRVLSYLPQVLSSYQWRAICGTVSYWSYFDRSGELVTCDLSDLNACQEKISITKEQLEELLVVSQPDAMMALIAESMPDIVPTSSPVSEQYRMIKDSHDLAKRHEINDSADTLALAVAAYLTKGESNVDKRLESLLQQHAWHAGSLGDTIVDAKII